MRNRVHKNIDERDVLSIQKILIHFQTNCKEMQFLLINHLWKHMLNKWEGKTKSLNECTPYVTISLIRKSNIDPRDIV